MAAFLLKLVFSLLATLSNLLTRLIFTTAAHVVVQVIQVLKVPGESGQRVLDQVKNLITTFLEFLMDLIIKAISSIISSAFDFVKEGLFSSSSGVGAAVAGLLEKSKTSLDDAFKDVPEVLEAFTDMLGNIIKDLFKNWNEALAYVRENVLK